MIKGLKLAKACAKAADENKAEDIRVLDLRGISTITDFIVICSGNSLPHLKAIMRDIDKDLCEHHDATPHRAEGKAETRWVVLDYIDVMVHIMLEDMRELYALEELWGDAAIVEWEA